jgi:erythromycin esterase-like protein
MSYGSNKRFQFRDSVMAENFFDIYETKYANRKVIIWLSNLHALYDSGHSKINFKTFAGYLKNRYHDKMYSLCFTSYVNIDKNGKIINKSTPSTLEYQLHKEKYKSAFIDFKNNKTLENQIFKTRINQNLILKANWTKMCDGIFYIDIIQQNK